MADRENLCAAKKPLCDKNRQPDQQKYDLKGIILLKSGLSSTLDASRWIAALFVVISHAHHIVLTDFQEVQHKTIFWKSLYFFGSFGREAVVIFFVVSGLLVGGLTTKKWLDGKKDDLPLEVGKYFAQRGVRIYTVLIPALIFGGVFDYLRYRYFNLSALFSDAAIYGTYTLKIITAYNLNASSFAGSTLMLENILVPVWGSNGPLWSLAYEWWYYCIFAVVMSVLLQRGAKRIVAILFSVGMFILLPEKLLLWGSIWIIGLLAFFYSQTKLPKPHPALGVILLLTALVISRFNHLSGDDGGASASIYPQFMRDFLLAIVYAVALVSFSQIEKPIRLAAIHARLASFSYSIYLTHFPLLLLLVSIFHASIDISFRQQPSASSYAYLMLMVALLYLFGYLFSCFTEKHNSKVLSIVVKIFGISRKKLSSS